MLSRTMAATAAIVFLCASAASAQQPAPRRFAPGTPEAVALAYSMALTAGRADQVAGMMHPEALATFRAMVMPAVEIAARSPESAGELLEVFDGIDSAAQLVRLDDAAFFSAFFVGITAEVGDALRLAETEILGHVAEGPDTAHVLYRMTWSNGTTSLSTVSMRRGANGWGMLLSGEIVGVAEMLRQEAELKQR